jgi:hypothetical protein
MSSLTETAKAVLEGKELNEGIPAIASLAGGVSNPNPVDPSATLKTGNAKTLKPKSRATEPDPKHNEAQDLGGSTPTSLYKDNIGAKAANGLNKKIRRADKSNSESMHKLAEDEVVDEEILSEEEAALEDFIAECIEKGMSEEEIHEALDQILAEEDEDDEKVNNKKEERRERLKEDDYQIDMSEHVEALLAGENLSEEFKDKATAIFESAVATKLNEEIELLEAAYEEALEERVEQIKESLANDVDDYLTYVVEQWIEDNEIAVESSLRSELTEDFISGLRQLFTEHYIDLPEDRVDVLEELTDKVEELEDKLNEEIENGVALTKALNESRKNEIVYAMCEGLTDTQAEKLKTLSEGVSFTGEEEFVSKVETLRENYFPTSVKNDEVLDKVETTTDPNMLNEANLDGPMSKYVRAIGKKLPN